DVPREVVEAAPLDAARIQGAVGGDVAVAAQPGPLHAVDVVLLGCSARVAVARVGHGGRGRPVALQGDGRVEAPRPVALLVDERAPQVLRPAQALALPLVPVDAGRVPDHDDPAAIREADVVVDAAGEVAAGVGQVVGVGAGHGAAVGAARRRVTAGDVAVVVARGGGQAPQALEPVDLPGIVGPDR